MYIRNKLFQSCWNIMSKDRRKRKEKLGKRDPSDILWWLHLGNFPLICPNLKLKKGNCIFFPQARSPFLCIHSFFLSIYSGYKYLPCLALLLWLSRGQIERRCEGGWCEMLRSGWGRYCVPHPVRSWCHYLYCYSSSRLFCQFLAINLGLCVCSCCFCVGHAVWLMAS